LRPPVGAAGGRHPPADPRDPAVLGVPAGLRAQQAGRRLRRRARGQHGLRAPLHRGRPPRTAGRTADAPQRAAGHRHPAGLRDGGPAAAVRPPRLRRGRLDVHPPGVRRGQTAQRALLRDGGLPDRGGPGAVRGRRARRPHGGRGGRGPHREAGTRRPAAPPGRGAGRGGGAAAMSTPSLLLVATVAVLYTSVFYLLLQRSLMRVVFGFLILGHAANLSLLLTDTAITLPPLLGGEGGRQLSDPLP